MSKDLKVIIDEFRKNLDGTVYYNGRQLTTYDIAILESAIKIAMDQIS